MRVLQCGFCNRQVHEMSVTQKSKIDIYKCTGCGLVLCKSCLKNMGAKHRNLFSSEYLCPSCKGKCIEIT